MKTPHASLRPPELRPPAGQLKRGTHGDGEPLERELQRPRLFIRIDADGNARMSSAGYVLFLAAGVFVLGVGWWVSGALAQSLPAPSRTVFKCEVAGKVVYSDSPCLGAKKIEAEPTRGVDKLSGQGRTGDDVHRERRREIMHGGVIQPLTGMDAKQYESYQRRFKLPPDAKEECAQLDNAIARSEHDERIATKEALGDVQARLFAQKVALSQARVLVIRRMVRSVQCSGGGSPSLRRLVRSPPRIPAASAPELHRRSPTRCIAPRSCSSVTPKFFAHVFNEEQNEQ